MNTLKELPGNWRATAQDFDRVVALGENAPHSHLREEAKENKGYAAALRDCANTLEKAISTAAD